MNFLLIKFILVSLIIIKVKTLETCGINPHNITDHTRIVGGHNAKKGSWPWQVSLRLTLLKELNICSGTLINDRWVLTAGHCFNEESDPNSWIAVLGSYNQTQNETTAVEMAIDKIIVHPKFTMDPRAMNDLTLIKLNHSLDLKGVNKQLTPVCIPSHLPANYTKLKCVITGWGYNSYPNGEHRDVLNEAIVPLLNTEKCFEQWGPKIDINSALCAGGLEKGGLGTCKGDSGGPLQCQLGDNKWYQFGITSWGKKCALPLWPDIFTKVTYFYDWIENTIDNH